MNGATMASELCNCCSVLFCDRHIIDAATADQAYLTRLGGEQITKPGWGGVGDAIVLGHGRLVATVAREGKRAVGQGKCNSAMADAVPVGVMLLYRQRH